MYKYELHAHTSECDRAAHLSARELVHMYKDAGYDGIVITDHYFQLFSQWFEEELRGLSHTQRMDRWLKGYYTARDEGDKIGFTVLPGAEVRFDHCPNDYLLYGLDEQFFYSAPQLNELSGIEELVSLLQEDVCLVQAHPFRNGMRVETPKFLFGIEVFNGGTERFRNDLARQFAEYYDLAKTSGSDIHDPRRLAKGGILTEKQIRTPEDLRHVLRNGDFSLIENY